MYEKGQCVPLSKKEAAVWYRKAGNQGHAQAQCDLGPMYEKGRGVPKSTARALLLFMWRVSGARCWGSIGMALLTVSDS